MRVREELSSRFANRAITASFIVDFAEYSGTLISVPSVEVKDHMLHEFMDRVEEWTGTNGGVIGGHGTSRGAAINVAGVRSALLDGLGVLGAAAHGQQKQVQTRWNKNWETNTGTALNIAVGGLALVAGL